MNKIKTISKYQCLINAGPTLNMLNDRSFVTLSFQNIAISKHLLQPSFLKFYHSLNYKNAPIFNFSTKNSSLPKDVTDSADSPPLADSDSSKMVNNTDISDILPVKSEPIDLSSFQTSSYMDIKDSEHTSLTSTDHSKQSPSTHNVNQAIPHEYIESGESDYIQVSSSQYIKSILVVGVLGLSISYFTGYFREYHERSHPYYWIIAYSPFLWVIPLHASKKIPVNYFYMQIPFLLIGNYLGTQTMKLNPFYWEFQTDRHFKSVYGDKYVPIKRKHWLETMQDNK